MCDVCDSEGLNWRFLNGDKKLEKAALFKVYVGQVARIKICHIHNIELFTKGETRFLQNHLALAKSMAADQGRYR